MNIKLEFKIQILKSTFRILKTNLHYRINKYFINKMKAITGSQFNKFNSILMKKIKCGK